MNRVLNNYRVAVVVLAAALWMIPSTAIPQQNQQPTDDAYGAGAAKKGMSWTEATRLIKDLPTPRLPDGHPDLSGVYFSGVVPDVNHIQHYAPSSKTFDPKLTPQEKPSFQPWVLQKVKLMGDHLEKLVPNLECAPRGALAYYLGSDYPIQLVQNPQALVLLTESDTTYRFIPTDRRPHDEDAGPQYNGDSIGHWEGDTLVVDVTSLDTNVWIAYPEYMAWFPSDVVHYVERYSRPNLNTFIYQVTIDDRKILTKPWVSVPRRFTWAGPNKRLYERFCTNNQDYVQMNAAAAKKLTAFGNDERYFDEQEYEQLSKQSK